MRAVHCASSNLTCYAISTCLNAFITDKIAVSEHGSKSAQVACSAAKCEF